MQRKHKYQKQKISKKLLIRDAKKKGDLNREDICKSYIYKGAISKTLNNKKQTA